jgi:VanZ family protein
MIRDQRNFQLHGTALMVMLSGLTITFILSCWPYFHMKSYLGFQYHWTIDLIFHFSYYFFVAVLLFPLLNSNKATSWLFFPMLLLLSIVFESLQYLIPGRSFTVFDMFSNFLGIGVAALFSFWGKRH